MGLLAFDMVRGAGAESRGGDAGRKYVPTLVMRWMPSLGRYSLPLAEGGVDHRCRCWIAGLLGCWVAGWVPGSTVAYAVDSWRCVAICALLANWSQTVSSALR